jgi:hypothetical protein
MRKENIPCKLLGVPTQHLMACEGVTDDAKAKLRKLHKILNTFDLRQQINAKLRNTFSIPKLPHL